MSDISVIEKSNKVNGQNQLPGLCRPFYKKTGGLFMYSVSRPSKDSLMLSSGLVTFDLKIRCKVWHLWCGVAAMVDHPYTCMMYGCMFLYKQMLFS